MALLNLIGRISLNTGPFDAGLNSIQAKAAQAGAMLTRAFAPYIGAAAITAQARKTIQFASSINDLSEATGVSSERLQEFDHALRQNGSTLEAGAKALKMIAEARKQALKDPGGDAARAFSQFGISIDALRSITDAGELFLRLSDAVKGTAIDLNVMPQLLELIGVRNQQVIPAMIAGLREAGEQAQRLGLVMDNATVKSLDEASDAMDRFGKRIMTGLAPVLASLFETLVKIGHGFDIAAAGAVGAWTELFQGKKDPKGFAGYWDRIRFGWSAAALDEANIIRMQNKLAAAAAARKRQPLDIDLEGDAQDKATKELDRILAQIADKRRNAALAGMTDQQRRAFISDELDQARDEARRNFGIEDKPPLEQARQNLRVAELEEDLARIKDPAEKALSRLRAPSDSLSSIGNRLGEDPNSRASRDNLQRIRETLERIESASRMRRSNTLVFPTS
jgi:hypothetical protein